LKAGDWRVTAAAATRPPPDDKGASHDPSHLPPTHGFASSAGSRNAQYLRPRLAERSDVTFHAVEFSPTPADFEYLTVTGMINRLRQYILDRELTDVCLIGSSMGDWWD
jgi:predicted esterase YcpF (UPF0227 family)